MYQGFFVNLDRNQERRAALTKHLEAVGAGSRYQRIEAVDGRAVANQYSTTLDPGNLGLWLSQLKLLEAHRGSATHLHVIEDDTVLCDNAANKFDSILEQADAKLAGWDLLFTDILVPSNDVTLFLKLAKAMKEFEQTKDPGALDLQTIAFAGTSSFFLNRSSIEKYASLIADQWMLGVPIDIFVRALVHRGILKAYVTLPFQTSVSRDNLQSDIRGDLDNSRAVLTAYRRAFFEDADLGSLDSEMQQLIRGAELSPLASIYIKALMFNVSDQWVHF